MAIQSGRLTREKAAVQELYESLVFSIRDEVDLLEHTDAVEQAGLEDIQHAEEALVLAERQLEAAKRRFQLTRRHMRELERHYTADRLAAFDFAKKAGFGLHVRPEVQAAADGALAA